MLETAIGPVLALPLGKLNAARCTATAAVTAAVTAAAAAVPSGAGEAMAGETQDPVPSRAASRASHHQRPPHSGANDQRLAGETLDAARNHGTACGAPPSGIREIVWPSAAGRPGQQPWSWRRTAGCALTPPHHQGPCAQHLLTATAALVNRGPCAADQRHNSGRWVGCRDRLAAGSDALRPGPRR